jgi:hypothetical protein
MHIIQRSLHFKLFSGEIAIENQPSGELPSTIAEVEGGYLIEDDDLLLRIILPSVR